MKMKRLLLLLVMPLMVSCSSKTFDSKEKLWTYLKDVDNGYLQQKNVNGFEFSLLYKPTDLLVVQELSEKLTGKEREKKIKVLREKYNKYLYFSLSMSKNGQELLSVTPNNKQQFGSMVNQLAFRMGEKVHLFTSTKDTIPITDYIYPRMYGISKSTDILLVYPRDQKHLTSKELNLSIEDLGIYTGEVKFKISVDNINNEPTLKL